MTYKEKKFGLDIEKFHQTSKQYQIRKELDS